MTNKTTGGIRWPTTAVSRSPGKRESANEISPNVMNIHDVIIICNDSTIEWSLTFAKIHVTWKVGFCNGLNDWYFAGKNTYGQKNVKKNRYLIIYMIMDRKYHNFSKLKA